MRLYLLRHGDAEKESKAGKDFDRGLTELGRKQVERVKNRLENDYSDREFTVFCSAAQRTRETWQIIAPVVEVEELEFLDDLYLAERTQLLNFIWNVNHPTEDVLIIGHNKGISDLASYLLDERIMLPTSGFLVIDFPNCHELTETSLGCGAKLSKCFPVE
ncbi:SixA phosphatase family protein [Brumimicrobium oceani]|uniref:Phosphohistidine phosphatase SixA n=1 Tax=Brumimicrobium oceani TaxID=2100725 RepID=A0A2U2XGK8_9FLAO|nr:histidine phosphatase family protein [Brumimicrobium oceani]PWH86841.1 phosphohistidine phosphatase SixA [Brumimicrobium oceani]